MQLLRRLRALGRRPHRQAPPGPALILLYHRVAHLDTDPWRLCISPQSFAEHMKVLTSLGICVRVRDLVPALSGESGPPVFAVTFDDGYADNATIARRILAEHEVPATLFVVSDAVGTTREFWWDAIERVFLTPGELPPRLRLDIGGRVHEFDLGAAARYTPTEFQRHASWKAETDAPPGGRHKIYLAVWGMLVRLPSSERDEAVERILEWAGLDGDARAGYDIISREQLSALALDGQIEIGAHSRTHPLLTVLSPAELRDEIAGSKSGLEGLAGRPVVSFSYPHGRMTDPATAVVRETGFSTACTTRAEAVQRTPDPFRLPRVTAHDWNGEAFRQIVMQYVGGTA